ncbi:hypothetical protein MUP59_06115 [Candidatus Bathyarchaeota archaeon]|nr:hypothetical protein [Candidatus Bathyarchaeota archaeon]
MAKKIVEEETENGDEVEVDEETQARIEALAVAYQKRMLKRVAEGKELPGAGTGRGRLPAGIAEADVEEYIALRNQVKEIRELRRNARAKLTELLEQMDGMKGATVKKKVSKKGKK